MREGRLVHPPCCLLEVEGFFGLLLYTKSLKLGMNEVLTLLEALTSGVVTKRRPLQDGACDADDVVRD